MEPRTRLLISVCFAIFAVAAPWPIGGNWPFFRFAAICLTAIAVLVACLAGPEKSLRGNLPIVWMLLMLGAGYVLFQALPASSSLGSSVPIVNLERFENSGLTQVEIEQFKYPEVEAISVYPAITREKLVDLIIGIGIFISATLLLTDRQSIITTFVGIALSGVLITFFGVIQSVSWNGNLFWSIPIQGGNVFASFVNKNNAAGFLVVTFGAAMFFVSRQIIEWNVQTKSGLVNDNADWENRIQDRAPVTRVVLRFVANLHPKHLYSLAATVIIFGGVIASLSRGGMLAVSGAALLAFVFLARSNRKMVTAIAILMFAGGLAFVTFAERSDSVVEKIESFSDVGQAAAPRLAHWNDAIPFAMEHWKVGTGAGSYRYVTSTMQSFFFEKIFAHAENIFIETLIEVGIGGLLILLGVIFLCFRSCIRLIKRQEKFDQALGISGMATLVGIIIASSMDFGLYLPANTIVLAMFMGVIVGRDFTKRDERDSGNGWIAWICLFICLLGTLWGAYESFGVESRKYAKRQIGIINRLKDPANRYTASRSFKSIKASLDRAISIRPDDAEAQFQLGELYVAQFRTDWTKELLSSLEEQKRQAEELQGVEFEDIDTETVWQSTGLSFLHRDFRFAQRSNSPRLEELKNDPAIQGFLSKAYEQYQLATDSCERMIASRIRQAQLSPIFDPGTESKHISAALSTNFWNSQVLYECGLLALNSGNQDLAVELWSRCLSNPHTRKFEGPIVEFSLIELPMKRLFEELLPQNPDNLIHVARKYFQRPELTLPKKFLLIHTKRVISKTDLSDADRFYFLAEAERLSEEYSPAVENYRKALELKPAETMWRFEYAKCLHETGQYDEAIRQLKKCELENARLGSSIEKLLNKIRRDRVQKLKPVGTTE